MSRRRGTVYVLVLCAGVVFTAMGIGALSILRTQRAGEHLSLHAADARRGATGALEIASQVLAADPAGSTWRTQPGTFTAVDHTFDEGLRIAATIRDPAGDLVQNVDTPVRIDALGVRADARQGLRALATPKFAHLGAIEGGCVWVGGKLTWNNASVFGDATIGCNDTMHANASTIRPQAAAMSITGSTYSGGTRVLAQPLAMPTVSAIAAWSAIGTSIAYESLPGGELSSVLLSAASNPFGALNDRGVYVIDCGDKLIRIHRSRIVGTLVILNPGDGSTIDSGVLMQGNPDAPTLLVDGSITISSDSRDFTENDAKFNFNPPGTPYLGVSDSDEADSYPSLLQGLIYVHGDLTSQGDVTIEGTLLVGQALTTSGRLTIRSVKPPAPVLGFRRVSGWSIDRASIERLVY